MVLNMKLIPARLKRDLINQHGDHLFECQCGTPAGEAFKPGRIADSTRAATSKDRRILDDVIVPVEAKMAERRSEEIPNGVRNARGNDKIVRLVQTKDELKGIHKIGGVSPVDCRIEVPYHQLFCRTASSAHSALNDAHRKKAWRSVD